MKFISDNSRKVLHKNRIAQKRFNNELEENYIVEEGWKKIEAVIIGAANEALEK